MLKNIVVIATSIASSPSLLLSFYHTFMLANVVLLRLEWCDSVCCCFSLLQPHHTLCCKQVWNPKSKDEHQPSFFSSPLPFHLKSAQESFDFCDSCCQCNPAEQICVMHLWNSNWLQHLMKTWTQNKAVFSFLRAFHKVPLDTRNPKQVSMKQAGWHVWGPKRLM